MRNQIKLACLACRAAKVRCDGKRPCANCIHNQKECNYRPSRRGGARRGRAKHLDPAACLSPPIETQTSTAFSESTGASSSDAIYHHWVSGSTPNSLENSGRTDEPPTIISNANPKRDPVLRAYRNEDDLVNAYYIYIHPYFPVLPEPACPQYEDRAIAIPITELEPSLCNFPTAFTSSFSLALMSILVLVPVINDPDALTQRTVGLRRGYAALFAAIAFNKAQEAIEDDSGITHNTAGNCAFQSNTPSELEPVLALLLLSMYEHCQGGNQSKMRARANLALTTAMDLSLHILGPEAPESLDAKRRAWWATVFSVYQSSIRSGVPPIISMDDSRITTPLTEFRCCLEPWALLVRAQDALLKSSLIATQITSDDGSRLASSLSEQVRALDVHLINLMAESDSCCCITTQDGAEALATRNMWEIARAFIHMSRVKLHRLRAFSDLPFLSEYTEDKPNMEASSLLAKSPYSTRRADIAAIFATSEHDSALICLKSALTVSRVFRRLPSPDPFYSDTGFLANTPPRRTSASPTSPRSLPYMACCEMESACVLILLLHRTRTALSLGDFKPVYHLLSNPQPETEKQDVERLSEELDNGVGVLRDSLRRDSVFNAVSSMASQVDTLYNALLDG
ncbi:hypothetical protein BDV18DRAFT_161647 [Aspergillus unguis]